MWRHALIDLERERPLVTWDHRGLYESSPPPSDRYGPGAHAEDAVAALDYCGHARVLIASWSTGGRIALELARRHPERVAAMVIACGGYGYRLTEALLRREPWAALPMLAGAGKHVGDLLQFPLRAVAARPELPGLIRQSGLIAASADTGALVEFLRGMASCDLGTLLRSYEAVAGDSAADLLPLIHVPTLLLAGERDRVSPVSVMREMSDCIPGARLEVYERATHYLPIEYPARLSHDLRTFFGEVACDS
jgi:pimeloyl-ACP methyl ester carboxylesterase